MRQAIDPVPGPADPMLPGMGLLMVNEDLEVLGDGLAHSSRRRRGRIRRALASRTFAWILALLVALGAAGAAALAITDARGDVGRLERELATVRAQGAEAGGLLAAAEVSNADLEARVAALQAKIADLREAKVTTVVETETVTETVTRYVPNGKAIEVETTGFEGRIRIYDVRLTHSFGYSDLIGIAENTSGEVVSYAQLGCSFLDAKGGLLATGMDNKQGWQPGQSWGFVCSADVDATGGILRVDEMS